MEKFLKKKKDMLVFILLRSNKIIWNESLFGKEKL